MLEQWVARETIIGSHPEVAERLFMFIQQRVGGCDRISHMMKMLIAPALCNSVLNLELRQWGVTGICCQQRLHGRERATAVWWLSLQQLIDSFLSLPAPSAVLQRERSLERP